MLRFVRPDEVTDAAELDRYRTLLTDDERARVDRFVFERDRRIQLVARASLRILLAEMTGVPPQDFRFGVSGYGKPFLQFPAEFRNLRFNLSHTRGLIAILIADGVEAGVDVEEIRPMDQAIEVAARFFAPAEVDDLRLLEADAARDRFFQYWTLKESYIKARGLGLSLPLDRFWFDIPGGGLPPRISFAPGFQDDPARWEFWQQRVGPHHFAATTVERK